MTRQPAPALGQAGDSTDRELLQRFAQVRDENAFAALVQRHGAMVLRVCRRVLASTEDAEDVCQATFLTLARKATAVPWEDSVRCWLQAVARRLALQGHCSAARRGRHAAGRTLDGGWVDVPDPYDTDADPLEEVARRELCLVLDEELGRLPEKYRAPVVLCYLEGKTNEQAAGELAWPMGSMSRRLARARALLRDRLSRRGLALVVALACLTLGCLWRLVATTATPEARPHVARAMTIFGPGGAGGEGFESALLRVAERDQASREDRERLLRMARRMVHVADAIEDHDPGPRREDWKRLTAQMRRTGFDLAEALAHDDVRTSKAAARQLLVACHSCHTTFRN
jgi:RNA polymerase sigma factor (sigma-70 family)